MHKVDQLTAGQESMTRNVDQLTAGQEQMMCEIARLQREEQHSLHKNSEPSAGRLLLCHARTTVAGTDCT